MCLWAGIQDPHPEQANRAPNWEHPRPQEPFFIDVVTGTKRAGGASLYRGMEEGPFSSLCFLVLLRARQRQRTSQAVATRSPGRCPGLRAASAVISLGFQSAFRDTPRPVDITQHNHPKYPQSYSQSPRSACGVTGSLGTDQTWLPLRGGRWRGEECGNPARPAPSTFNSPQGPQRRPGGDSRTVGRARSPSEAATHTRCPPRLLPASHLLAKTPAPPPPASSPFLELCGKILSQTSHLSSPLPPPHSLLKAPFPPRPLHSL